MRGNPLPGKRTMPKRPVSKTSPSVTDEQLEALRTLLPHVFTEGKIDPEKLRAKLADQLVNGIQYEKINQWYEMTQFEDIHGWSDNLVPAEHSLYDHVVYESGIEKAFVEGLERRDDVKMYVKLPGWFTVPTPVGEYNPDWAIVLEPRDEFGKPSGEELLYLVRETKDTTDLAELRLDEARKIRCGERHFRDALGVDYRAVADASELE